MATHGFFVGGFANLSGEPGSTTQFEVSINANGFVSAAIDFCFPTDVFNPLTLSCHSCPFGGACTASPATIKFCDGSVNTGCASSCNLPDGQRVRIGVSNLNAPSGSTILSCEGLGVQSCLLDSSNTTPCPPDSFANVCYPVGIEATFTDAANVVFNEGGQVALQIFATKGGFGDFCQQDCQCQSGNCDEGEQQCQ